MMKQSAFMAVVAGSLMLAGCTKDVYKEPAGQYAENFVEEFGSISPDQDWNMAGQKTVNVNPGAASQVEIYTLNGDAYQLAGRYRNVSGRQTLTFDAAKSVNDFIVAAGGKALRVRNGGSADFANATTRTYQPDVSGVFTRLEDYKEFTRSEVMAFAETLPDGENNSGKATDNFEIIAGNERVTVFPVYWNAGNTHELGVYWYEGDVRRERVVYTSKQGDDVQYKENGVWQTPNVYMSQESLTDAATDIRSRGFAISLPAGTKYGFYINATYGGSSRGVYYSNAGLNADGDKHAFIFTDGKTGRTFLGFEDEANKDYDLNDLVLIIDPEPVIVNNDPQKWILAIEDLGDTDDYDFNDVVVEVEHVSGETTAKVTALAAGGSKDVQLYYVGAPVGGEFHTWFGEGAFKSGDFFNTQGSGARGKTIVIEGVPADFTLASAESRMGGFQVSVEGGKAVVAAPGAGEAPQMICVPGSWKWPKERINIKEAYPDFERWCADPGYDWMRTVSEDQVLGNTN